MVEQPDDSVQGEGRLVPLPPSMKSIMSEFKPPQVRYESDRFQIDLGPDFSHLHENVLEHLGIISVLAQSAEPPQVVVNMKDVQFIGSAVIGHLVAASKTLQARGGQLWLSNVNKFCQSVISVANLNALLPTLDS